MSGWDDSAPVAGNSDSILEAWNAGSVPGATNGGAWNSSADGPGITEVMSKINLGDGSANGFEGSQQGDRPRHDGVTTRPTVLTPECSKENAVIARHNAGACEDKRAIDYSHVKDKSVDEAWNCLIKSNQERDFDEFKINLYEYIKACPECNLEEIERAFRGSGFHYYLLALVSSAQLFYFGIRLTWSLCVQEHEVSYDKTIVGIHGEPNMKYTWSLNRSAKPRRTRVVNNRIAATPEENLARLKVAGNIMDELRPFCHNCKEKGHSGRNCEMDKIEEDRERVVLKCTNCESLDHRIRDCPEPRKVRGAIICKNCGEEGHKGVDCTEPPKPREADENTECRNCNGMGHFSRDCPDRSQREDRPPQVCFNCGQEGHRSSDCTNERVPKCRNCDEWGHTGKECTKPRDITRVKCNKCNEMGHFSRNCTAEVPADDDHNNDPYPAAQAPDNGHNNGPAEMGAWGAAEAAIVNPVGTWASNVNPADGGWGANAVSTGPADNGW
ncbi:hypothetical protein RUND412_009913 [Rhizina undulata]